MQYLHPSVETKIVDNSFVYTTADGVSTLFQPIVSSKGPDNKLTLVTTVEEFVAIFGEPNVSKYGQAGYNVIEWLKSGGIAYVLRVLPTTATYAATGIALELAGKDGSKKEVAVRSLNAIKGTFTSKGAITSKLNELVKTSPGSNFTIPLGVIIPKGRGEAYNTLGVRFTLRDDLDDTYSFRTYNIYVTDLDALGNPVEVEGPFIVSMDPEGVSKSRESLYWANVLNKYSTLVEVVDYRKGFEQAAEYLTDGTEVNPASIDLLFGRMLTTEQAEALGSITWRTPANKDEVGVINVENAELPLMDVNETSRLQNGTSGEWTGGDTEESLLVKAFTGLIDSTLLDKTAIEIDVMLDANYPLSVKNAMNSLATSLRGDCIAIDDVGFQANEQQTLAFRKDNLTISHHNVAIFAHDMVVYDPYNGQNIKVTSPYVLAGKIPTNDREFGIQYTFVGPRRGTVSGVENINFFPNPTWKEALYKAKVNYIERDPRKINFASQATSQVQNSALSDINNVRVLLKIRREVEKMMADYRMEFNDSGTHASMSYDLNQYLSGWVNNRACSVATGSVSASDYDRQQRIARVNIQLQFTGILERIAVSIVINR